MTATASVDHRARLRGLAIPIAGAILCLLPSLGLSAFWSRELMLIALLALSTSGMNLIFGYAGELALGQAAVYAAGAYAAAILATSWTTDVVVGATVGMGAGVLVGLVAAVPGLRLGGWSLAVASFFLVLLIPDIVSIFSEHTGGFVGLPTPRPTIFGQALDADGRYLVTMVSASAWFLLFRNFVTSRYGARLRVLRESPSLAESLGVPLYRTKLLAYALGAAPAGLAGVLLVHTDGYVAPSSFTLATTLSFLAASIVGGSGSVYGAVVGAVVLQQGPMRTSDFQEYALLAYGLFLLVGGIFLTGGLTGLGGRLLRRRRRASATLSTGTVAPDLPALRGLRVEIADVHKSFGGNRALRGVTMTVEPGQVTALVGPNGSGKTTLLNVISRFYRADAGTVLVDGVDVSTLRPHDLAARSVARTFQTPSIPESLSAHEVVETGTFASIRAGVLASVLRLPSYRKTRREVSEVARRTLAFAGIAEVSDTEGRDLPLGTRRLLELARAVASRPGLVLLDEPASGLDEHELVRLGELIGALRAAGCSVVLVEHNVEFVMSLADEVYVLAQGDVLASGPPEQVRGNPQVIAEYLGGSLEAVVEAGGEA